MANEVKIKVSVDETGASFDGVRKEAKKFEQESKVTGNRAGKNLGDGIESVMGGVAKNAGSLLAVMGPLAAPLIGASIGAAVIGGAAGVGIIGGIMVASKDARVQSAGKDLGHQLTVGLQKDAGSFVTPMLKSIDIIGSRFEQLRPKIRSIFDNSSQFLVPLTNGITKGVEGIVGGIEKAVQRAGPVVDAMSYLFENTGQNIGDFFDDASKGAKGAGDAIKDLSDAAGVLLKTLGPVVGVLGQVYEAMNKIGLTKAVMENLLGPIGTVVKGIDDWKGKQDELNGVLDRGAESGRRVGGGTFEAADGVTAVAEAAGASVFSLEAMADALDRVTNQNMTLYDSNIKAEEAIDRVTEARKKNGRTLDLNTEKGRDNAAALSTLAKALKKNYDASVDLNGVGPKTDAVAAKNRESFIKLATQMTGSASKARALADKILGIPVKHETRITANTANASARAAALRKQLEGIPDQTVNINIRTRYSYSIGKQDEAMARRGKRDGGIAGSANGASPSGLTWVGEDGPELMSIAAGTRVWSAGDSRRMATKHARSAMDNVKQGFDGNLVVHIAPNSERSLVHELLRIIRWEIGLQGGNVQSVLGRN